MRRLGEADRPAIEAVLGARLETSMFPLSNLARFGMAGGAPRAMRFWGAGEPLSGVLGATEEGMVMPQLPPALAAEAARALAGERILGILGDERQVEALRGAMGLATAPAQIDRPEPLFTLDLSALRRPATAGLRLVPLAEVPRGLLLAWSEAYGREVLGWGEGAAAQAEADIAFCLAAGLHRALLRDGVPVAMTGFNAALPEAVQVGGVWTPPELRGQGLARAAVALHLEEARAAGVRRAILFSASEAATRAYRALGFEAVGRFTLLVFDGPQEVRPG